MSLNPHMRQITQYYVNPERLAVLCKSSTVKGRRQVKTPGWVPTWKYLVVPKHLRVDATAWANGEGMIQELFQGVFTDIAVSSVEEFSFDAFGTYRRKPVMTKRWLYVNYVTDQTTKLYSSPELATSGLNQLYLAAHAAQFQLICIEVSA